MRIEDKHHIQREVDVRLSVQELLDWLGVKVPTTAKELSVRVKSEPSSGMHAFFHSIGDIVVVSIGWKEKV